jgi:tetrahydromethanopterin S-methyltransferase subunit B
MAKKKPDDKKDQTMRSLDDPWVPSSELPPEPATPKKPRKPRKKNEKASSWKTLIESNFTGPTPYAAPPQTIVTFDEHRELIKQKEAEIEVLLESHASILGVTSALFSFSLAMIIGAFIGLFTNFFHGIVGMVIFGVAACSIFFMTKHSFPKKYEDWNEFKGKIKKQIRS